MSQGKKLFTFIMLAVLLQISLCLSVKTQHYLQVEDQPQVDEADPFSVKASDYYDQDENTPKRSSNGTETDEENGDEEQGSEEGDQTPVVSTTTSKPNTNSSNQANSKQNTTKVENKTTAQPNGKTNQAKITAVPTTISANNSSNQTTPKQNTTTPQFLPAPAPTTFLPNPEKNLTAAGLKCLQRCRSLGGVSCKKWDDDSITCCQFTGCQWPFYCTPQARIMVEGCQNKP